jgi:hypothetical protein
MRTPPSIQHWLRLAVDCILVVLLVLALLVLVVNAQPQSAQPGLDADTLTSPQPASAQAQLDNNTLAAMIAAENGALTLPVFFASLPLTLR